MKINGRCPYLVIVGATATGKTSVAIKLAKKISGEIISADSRQIYKYLTVGTAKPQGYDIPYHLVDFLEPKEKFSAGEFVRLAEEFIEKIAARGKQPIIVGGTGLYIKTLIDGIVRLPSADEKLRQKLHKLVETRGKKHLHMLLKKFDPASAEKIHPNNTVRIIRALEVY
ncbi:MAG: tRNA (adenosine(37)-N6)-dimethylallyltransferase MiaA, partial [Elusimicrobia bacterium CG02_land_8_20_14_3_00_37_13]